VLLKQRHDELPKLVEVCKQYKQFEQETLQRVIEARSMVQTARQGQDIEALGKAEGMLRMGLGNIFAVAEAYPELKTNQNFMQLQTRITGLENGIADRRELYNESVNIYNSASVFPASIIAKLFNGAKPLLESPAKADVDMSGYSAKHHAGSLRPTTPSSSSGAVTATVYRRQTESREAWLGCLSVMAIISFATALGTETAACDTRADFKVASAAQGYVELIGRGKRFGEMPLINRQCPACGIATKSNSVAQKTKVEPWTAASSDSFLLRDDRAIAWSIRLPRSSQTP
jgi:LemA protein